ncbi:TRAP transporter fused permease subunit [Sulfuritalea sp.]|uniref:TRAP transporter permease n=1 Tax=Sulfuritalea sp. TaxID=2480090 RepID=UPI001AC78683|nr:TRAP transporter fused permease subunit [Sulfuritalea sp.]MBN8475812.1 TRAP transporter fused permease subunit [Sulfuritalea sp.]
MSTWLGRLHKGITYALALAVSLYGLANVMPAVGSFRLGPFPMELFRASFFAMCVAVVGLNVRGPRGQAPGIWLAVTSAISVAVLMWASVSFYRVSISLNDAMVLFGAYEATVAVVASAAVLFFCWRIWGSAVALLGILGVIYLITGPYWPGPLATIPGDLSELLAQNLWYSLDTGILGATFAIVITTVFPFIVLGAVLDGVGAADSMIRIAFALMKRTAGGPAHAAVLASALFGTVSGSAVANVVGTGVVTIPMIRKRGYTREFAGAVEAAASTGGQIMPPIMGAAALVMADYVGVSYLTVVVAVLIPSIAYYLSLFLMIMFETRRLGIQADASASGIAEPSLQDYLNMVLIFGPLILIVILLVAGASASGASIAAIVLLFPLSFINPAIRARPHLLITALRNGGATFAELLTAIAAIGIVISTLSATGMPVKFGVLMDAALNQSLFVALLVVFAGCTLLGMGMPTLPAYLTVAAIAVPSMQSLGLEPLTAHMFVFMIAVASAITPPVAIAAYAAASISGGKPIATAVVASRIGIMIFLIPFAFAYDPLLLTVKEAGAIFTWPAYIQILVALAFAMYMCASALSLYELGPLPWWQVVLRLLASVLLLAPGDGITWAGIALSVVLLAQHRFVHSRRQQFQT